METWPVNTYNSQEFGIASAVIIWPQSLLFLTAHSMMVE